MHGISDEASPLLERMLLLSCTQLRRAHQPVEFAIAISSRDALQQSRVGLDDLLADCMKFFVECVWDLFRGLIRSKRRVQRVRLWWTERPTGVDPT